MTIPNYPRPEVKAFGERVSEAMYDASIRYSMGGLAMKSKFLLSSHHHAN